MFTYATPPIETKLKLMELGYSKDSLFSYPEIAQWLGDTKKCILSPEMINSTEHLLHGEPELMGIVYLGHEQTIKSGLYHTVSEALKDMVEYVIREQYDWLSKSYLGR